MLPATRHRALLQQLANSGQAGIVELAAALGVSDDTIRRDLKYLEARGLLIRSHGGAVLADMHTLPRSARDAVLPEVKGALGRAVADAIPSGASLMLDAGSTLLAVAQALHGPHRVVTHSLDVAQALSIRPEITLVLAGGEWDARQRLFRGPATVDTVRRYRVDLAILGACALHRRHGLTASEAGDAEVKRAMLACSDTHWLAADHLKFDTLAPHAVAPLDDFTRLFCDRPFSTGSPAALPAGLSQTSLDSTHDTHNAQPR